VPAVLNIGRTSRGGVGLGPSHAAIPGYVVFGVVTDDHDDVGVGGGHGAADIVHVGRMAAHHLPVIAVFADYAGDDGEFAIIVESASGHAMGALPGDVGSRQAIPGERV